MLSSQGGASRARLGWKGPPQSECEMVRLWSKASVFVGSARARTLENEAHDLATRHRRDPPLHLLLLLRHDARLQRSRCSCVMKDTELEKL